MLSGAFIFVLIFLFQNFFVIYPSFSSVLLSFFFLPEFHGLFVNYCMFGHFYDGFDLKYIRICFNYFFQLQTIFLLFFLFLWISIFFVFQRFLSFFSIVFPLSLLLFLFFSIINHAQLDFLFALFPLNGGQFFFFYNWHFYVFANFFFFLSSF